VWSGTQWMEFGLRICQNEHLPLPKPPSALKIGILLLRPRPPSPPATRPELKQLRASEGGCLEGCTPAAKPVSLNREAGRGNPEEA